MLNQNKYYNSYIHSSLNEREPKSHPPNAGKMTPCPRARVCRVLPCSLTLLNTKDAGPQLRMSCSLHSFSVNALFQSSFHSRSLSSSSHQYSSKITLSVTFLSYCCGIPFPCTIFVCIFLLHSSSPHSQNSLYATPQTRDLRSGCVRKKTGGREGRPMTRVVA